MPSFSEGFAKALGGQIGEETQSRRQGMLEMMMLSKKIEMEQQARQQELEQAHQYSLVPGEQLTGLMKTLGVKNAPDLSDQMIPESLAGHLIQGFAMESAYGGRNSQLVSYLNPDGTTTLIPTNKATGEQTGTGVNTGLQKDNYKKIAESDNAYQNAMGALGNMAQRVQQVLTKVPGFVPGQEANVKIQDLFPYDPQLKAFMVDIPANVMQLAKQTQGSVGRSWQMIQKEIAAYPNASDTVESAMAKLDMRKQDFETAMRGTHSAFDPSGLMPLPGGSQGQSQSQMDPSSAYQMGVSHGASLGQMKAQLDAKNAYLSSLGTQANGPTQ